MQNWLGLGALNLENGFFPSDMHSLTSEEYLDILFPILPKNVCSMYSLELPQWGNSETIQFLLSTCNKYLCGEIKKKISVLTQCTVQTGLSKQLTTVD